MSWIWILADKYEWVEYRFQRIKMNELNIDFSGSIWKSWIWILAEEYEKIEYLAEKYDVFPDFC